MHGRHARTQTVASFVFVLLRVGPHVFTLVGLQWLATFAHFVLPHTRASSVDVAG